MDTSETTNKIKRKRADKKNPYKYSDKQNVHASINYTKIMTNLNLQKLLYLGTKFRFYSTLIFPKSL